MASGSVSQTLGSGDVVNNLTSTETQKPGSANMLRVLNDKFIDVDFDMPLPTGYSWNTIRKRIFGNGWVYISGRIDLATATTSKELSLGVIVPEIARPTYAPVTISAFNNTSDKPIHGIITTNGNLSFYRSDTDSLNTIVFTVYYSTK